jgi:hypothetical protein
MIRKTVEKYKSQQLHSFEIAMQATAAAPENTPDTALDHSTIVQKMYLAPLCNRN